jgi:hypothetical protein
MILFNVLVCLASCFEPDPDDDQLLTVDEQAYGTDPQNPDSDGDGLKDGHEVYFTFTDPTSDDSDVDGFDDGWEFDRELDPNNPDSRGYLGGWPMLATSEKDNLASGELPLLVEVGMRLKRSTLSDQFTDRYDIYDAALTGKYTMLSYNGDGNFLSWIGTDDGVPVRGEPLWLKDYVLSGNVNCINIESGTTCEEPQLIPDNEWFTGFPDSAPTLSRACRLLVDSTFEQAMFLNRPEYPNGFFLLDDRMIVRAIDDFDEMKRLIDAGLPAPAED